MKIFLDSKDLIDICERASPCTIHELNKKLREGKHTLVLSIYSILEIAAPFATSTNNSHVLAMLDRLEVLPNVFFYAFPEQLELNQALDAFRQGREYQPVFPYVAGFDDAIAGKISTPHRIVSSMSFAETALNLRSHNALEGLDRHAQRMREIIKADRDLTKRPSLRVHFVNVIKGNLDLHHISYASINLAAFAEWVYLEPSRCPSIRLSYEAFHKVIRNTTDSLQDSDMEDYQHQMCLPYVDLMTVDRRMRGYLEQASASLGLDYAKRLFTSTKCVIDRL